MARFDFQKDDTVIFKNGSHEGNFKALAVMMVPPDRCSCGDVSIHDDTPGKHLAGCERKPWRKVNQHHQEVLLRTSIYETEPIPGSLLQKVA